MRNMLRVIALFLLTFSALAQTPAAITTDPPRDADHPARMVEMRLTSHGQPLNGVFYLAAGAGPHPTALFLHGFPGFEQNLDLAQAMRRAGWNVLSFNYRGNWGSGGDFTFQNALDDTETVIDWLESREADAKYNIDPKHIVLVGHSMGGFLGMMVGQHHPELAAFICIAPWNIGADARNWTGRHRADALKGFAAEINALHGTTPEKIVAEGTAHENDWDLLKSAPAFKDRPFYLLWGTHDDPQDQLRDALAKSDTRFKATVMDTDHPFSDHRIALETAVIEWLQGLH
jgi:uncharacterized protein